MGGQSKRKSEGDMVTYSKGKKKLKKIRKGFFKYFLLFFIFFESLLLLLPFEALHLYLRSSFENLISDILILF